MWQSVKSRKRDDRKVNALHFIEMDYILPETQQNETRKFSLCFLDCQRQINKRLSNVRGNDDDEPKWHKHIENSLKGISLDFVKWKRPNGIYESRTTVTSMQLDLSRRRNSSVSFRPSGVDGSPNTTNGRQLVRKCIQINWK